MKCKHCGNDLQIEDRVCPFCGQPNPFAVRHQQEMQRFAREFEETREDVLEQSGRFNRRTVRITILAVLIAACAVMTVLCFAADGIRYWREDKKIAADADLYRAELDRMIEERSYTGVYDYISERRLSGADLMREYDAVWMASMCYHRFYVNLMMLAQKTADPDAYTYYSESELFEEIAESVRGIYEEMQEDPYHPEAYTEEKMAYMRDMADTAGQMLVRYTGITEEEAAQIPEMSMARLNVMMEDAYENRPE